MIIPVYNGEKYISDCIESVLCQVYNDFEIIVIDDGSSDNTAEVCGKFDRIRYFHQENRGVSMARQKGLELAEGEFITFIDGDDTVSPDFLERMSDEIGDNDVVCCNSVDEAEYENDIYIYEDETVFDKERVFRDYFSCKRYTTCIWGKLFRKHILEKIEFPEMDYAEDTYIIHKYFAMCESIRLIKYQGYFYRNNSEGAMNGFMGFHQKYDMLKCSLYIYEACLKYPSVIRQAEMKLTGSLFDLAVHFDIRDDTIERAFALAERRSLKGKLLILYRYFPKIMPRKGMKIGIHTLNDNENYGNRLQNYAVNYIFSRYGKVYNIGKRFFNFKYLIWRITGGKIQSLFTNKNYRIYKLTDFNRRMKYSLTRADIDIYGSDQIWNPYYADKSLINPLTKNNIAFCASFGLSEIPKEYENLFREGLEKFHSVSVRENRGAEIFFDHTGRNAEILCDPTMYVPKEHWQSFEKCPKGFENKKYVFEYFIDGKNNEQFSVEEFLYLIVHAESIITDSFHVCVFSLIFGKKFTVKERKNNGFSMQSRIDTLLRKAENGIDFESERRKTDKFIMSALRNLNK